MDNMFVSSRHHSCFDIVLRKLQQNVFFVVKMYSFTVRLAKIAFGFINVCDQISAS